MTQKKINKSNNSDSQKSAEQLKCEASLGIWIGGRCGACKNGKKLDDGKCVYE